MKVAAAVRRKTAFHHGDLREALIAATRQLLVERGADGFSLADACRLAGVSTAAPYKHFRDKQEILQEIVERAFDDMTNKMLEAVAKAGEGTIEAIIAIGQSYLAFALREPAVFRFMFGHNAAIKQHPDVEKSGEECFGKVIAQVAHYCRNNGLADDAERLALELWTFVHGAACLVIDDDYEKVAPGLDPAALIAGVAPRLLR